MSLEAVDGGLLVDVVEVDVGGVDNSVGADLVEGVEPLQTLVLRAGVGDGRTENGDIGVSRGDGVHVLLPGSAGSLRGHVGLSGNVRLVEAHDSLGSTLDGGVDVGQPRLGGGVLGLVHHGDEGSTDILGLGLGPVVGEAEALAEGGAELTIVVGKTTLGAAVIIFVERSYITRVIETLDRVKWCFVGGKSEKAL